MRRIVRQIHVLWRTESLLAELRFAAATRRTALFICAAVVGAAALAMVNVAAFFALLPGAGLTLAPLLVALGDAVGAGILLAMAQRGAPTAEVALLREVRDLALQELEAESAAIEAEVRSAGDQVRDLMRNPLGAVTPALAFKLIKSAVAGLRGPATK